MKSNIEIRDNAWMLLWQSKWLSRFVFLIVAFGFIRYIAVNFALSLLGSTVDDILMRLYATTDLEEVAALFRDTSWLKGLTLITVLSLFVATVINSIATYGLSRVRIAVGGGDNPQQWQKMGFSGFRDPFGMFALDFLLALFVGWPIWFVAIPALAYFIVGSYSTGQFSPVGLAVLPSLAVWIVLFYRYRQAWFLKASHPDWSALKCLRKSAELMNGRKWRCFQLDCAFWRPITLQMTTVLLATICQTFEGPAIATMVATLLITALGLYLNAYIPLAQAIFHIQIIQQSKSSDATSASITESSQK